MVSNALRLDQVCCWVCQTPSAILVETAQWLATVIPLILYDGHRLREAILANSTLAGAAAQ